MAAKKSRNATKKRAAKKAAGRKHAAKIPTTKKAGTQKAAAKKRATKKSRKAAKKKAASKKSPKASSKKAAPKKPASKKAATKKAAAKKASKKASKKAAPKKAARLSRRKSTALAKTKPTTVDEYIASFDDWRGETLAILATLVRKAAPGATDAIKWSQPVFSSDGPMVFMKAAKAHVTLGFWRGTELEDPKGLLEGSGKRMAHVKLHAGHRVPKTALRAFVKQAARLNREHGDPTKKKS